MANVGPTPSQERMRNLIMAKRKLDAAISKLPPQHALLYERWGAVVAAEVDLIIPIPPLRKLIAQYAEFIRRDLIGIPVRGNIMQAACIIPDRDRSFLIAMNAQHQIGRINVGAGEGTMEIYAGDGKYDSKEGPLLSTSFYHPRSICAHPTLKNHYFIADSARIRYSDGVTISSFVGYGAPKLKLGDGDGIGEIATFGGQFLDLVCTSNGRTLYVADCGNCVIRTVDVASRTVRTCSRMTCSLEHPQKLVWYRSPTTKPDSILYITTRSGSIFRFDVQKMEMTKPEWNAKPNPECAEKLSLPPWNAESIGCTSNGTLIFICSRGKSLWALDPTNGESQLLTSGTTITAAAGCGKDEQPLFISLINFTAFYIDESLQRVWLMGNGLHYVELAPHLFW